MSTDQAETMLSSLPYQDSKPVGAADFYFAINATFRFILGRFGLQGLRDYWAALGRDYFAPVSGQWRSGAGRTVATHWRDFFRAEPGADVTVTERTDRVEVEVHVCPAILHLRANQREIVPAFCQHCFYVGDAMAGQAGMALRVRGGNGSCRQTIYLNAAEAPEQLPEAIEEAR